MNTVAKILGLLALAGTVLPSVLFSCKVIGEQPMKMVMLLSTVVWFVAAPLWLKGGDK